MIRLNVLSMRGCSGILVDGDRIRFEASNGVACAATIRVLEHMDGIVKGDRRGDQLYIVASDDLVYGQSLDFNLCRGRVSP